jgi:plasmid stabilization system protein ParE
VSISYSPEAIVDLADIIVYGNDVWGFEQTILYLDQLEASISTLVDFPQIGRAEEAFAPGIR